mmetsp:Transcript_29648/g.88714  ORF Transcript_29648/g.88714 Transcript_29648/m.88714 type:complete len:82 (+) Transcript_29648:23-268(+)
MRQGHIPGAHRSVGCARALVAITDAEGLATVASSVTTSAVRQNRAGASHLAIHIQRVFSLEEGGRDLLGLDLEAVVLRRVR